MRILSCLPVFGKIDDFGWGKPQRGLRLIYQTEFFFFSLYGRCDARCDAWCDACDARCDALCDVHTKPRELRLARRLNLAFAIIGGSPGTARKDFGSFRQSRFALTFRPRADMLVDDHALPDKRVDDPANLVDLYAAKTGDDLDVKARDRTSILALAGILERPTVRMPDDRWRRSSGVSNRWPLGIARCAVIVLEPSNRGHYINSRCTTYDLLHDSMIPAPRSFWRRDFSSLGGRKPRFGG